MISSLRRVARLVAAFACVLGRSLAAETRPSTFVDPEGVMRWTESRAEVVQFGVNYTAPFAHAFRAHQRLGVPIERAIDADVYHFARLGFDAYRIHVWDREISDGDGNLLANEHVAALDYLLAQLKRRGIKIILTPLEFSNAAYPEPPAPLPGFSTKYGKRGCLEDRTSWPLQERYLSQFICHVNPHTGLAYKDDPDVIAFEVCNEPGHSNYDLTIAYINTMVRAMRATGCAQPIFYNMSHGIPVHQAYLDADVQGGTFQWYPVNLVAGREQRGNFLPYVDHYPIPFGDNPKFRTKAKMVYEFDAADIGRSYIYPAIARTYRTAGFQFATQFAYDPLHIAPFNTEYQTHFLNLAYSPSKALGMKIAAETFRRVPRGKNYGDYPNNRAFEGVRVDYEQDLAELITERDYFHSNHTTTAPPSPTQLERIAGYGRSPVVDYPGHGAYFLDRLEPGVWRLEVMPDAIWVRDPFERASPHKQVVRIAWNEWPMRITLPDLGGKFSVAGLNDGNAFSGRSDEGALNITPGAYLLTRDGVAAKWSASQAWSNITLKEFVAPPASLDKTYVLHHPASEASAGGKLRLTATIASPAAFERAEVVAVLARGTQTYPLTRVAGLEFAAEIPAGQLAPGTLRYHIVVRSVVGTQTFPSEQPRAPNAWDFFGDPWSTRLVPANAPVVVFDAATNQRELMVDYRQTRIELVSFDRPGTTAMTLAARNLETLEHDASFRFHFKDKVAGRAAQAAQSQRIVVYGRSASDEATAVQVSLVTADGIAYGAMVNMGASPGRYSVPIDTLRQVRAPNIPHGYPTFIPFWSSARTEVPLDLGRAEAILVSIGPGIAPADYRKPHSVQIERIWLE